MDSSSRSTDSTNASLTLATPISVCVAFVQTPSQAAWRRARSSAASSQRLSLRTSRSSPLSSRTLARATSFQELVPLALACLLLLPCLKRKEAEEVVKRGSWRCRGGFGSSAFNPRVVIYKILGSINLKSAILIIKSNLGHSLDIFHTPYHAFLLH